MDQKIPRRTIVLLTAQAFGVMPKEFQSFGRRRGLKLARARKAAALLVKEYRPETSWQELANALGQINHTSAIFSLSEARKLAEQDETFRADLDEARGLIAKWHEGNRGPAFGVVFCPTEVAA